MVSASYSVVSGDIRWFQLVLDGFRRFKFVPCFSKYGTFQCWLRFDVVIFLQKFTSH